MQTLETSSGTFYAFTQMEIFGAGAVAIFVIMIFVMLFVLTAPVSVPYLKAFIKGKYLLFVLEKTNRTKIVAPEFKNGVAHIKGTPARYVKNEYNGSYNLGTMKCDIAIQGTAQLLESEYNAAFEVIEQIPEMKDLSENKICAYLTACVNDVEFYEALKAKNPNFDLNIVIPAFTKVKLSNLARYMHLTPEDITSYVTGEVESAKEPYMKKNENSSKGHGSMIAIVAIILVVVIVGAVIAKMMGAI